jgi:hypothetical protein
MRQHIPFLDELKQDLMAHVPSPTAVERHRIHRVNPAWVAIAVFVGTLLVGGLSWALLGSEPQPVASGPLTDIDWDLMVKLPTPDDSEALMAEIESIQGITVVEYFPDASVLDPAPPPATMVTFSPEDADFEVGALLLRLDDVDDAETVATRLVAGYEVEEITYSDEIAAMMADRYFEFAAEGATVIGEDPLVLQPSQGPTPRFDTTGLGTELDLVPATSVDEIPDNFWTLPGPMPELNSSVRSEARPMLHIGYLPEIDYRMVVYGTVSDGRCDVFLRSTSSGMGCGDFSYYPYRVSGFGGIEGEIGYVFVVVPEATSVVTISFDGAEPMWQRPVAGVAMFPSRIDDGITYAAVAYDATGAIIGHWEGTS